MPVLGLRVELSMIVDFRVRPPFRAFTSTALYKPRNPNPDPVTVGGLLLDMPYYRSFAEQSIEAFVEEMDEAGIDMAVVMGRQSAQIYGFVPNQDVVGLIEAYPDR